MVLSQKEKDAYVLKRLCCDRSPESRTRNRYDHVLKHVQAKVNDETFSPANMTKQALLDEIKKINDTVQDTDTKAATIYSEKDLKELPGIIYDEVHLYHGATGTKVRKTSSEFSPPT